MILKFEEFINESISDTHQQRFDRAIYLTYVGYPDVAPYTHEQNNFKVVTKKEFETKLKPIVDKVETKKYDLKNRHRIADTKDVWLNKNKQIIGEVFKEVDEDGDSVESYWINRANVK